MQKQQDRPVELCNRILGARSFASLSSRPPQHDVKERFFALITSGCFPLTEAIKKPRIEGPTPNGGAYAIAYTHDDASMEIVEFNAQGEEIARTYSRPASKPDVNKPFSL
jgi:hypothetical protein